MVYSAHSLESLVTSREISRYISAARYVSQYFPGSHMTPKGKKIPMQACNYITCTVHLAKAGRGTHYRKVFGIGKRLFLLIMHVATSISGFFKHEHNE